MFESGVLELVPDPQVRREFGGVSEMTIWRWDRDPKMAELGWPSAVKIRKRKFRPRKQLEAFKANLLRQARSGAKIAQGR